MSRKDHDGARRGLIGRATASAALGLVLAGSLTGCNQEDDRVLVHEPGVYQGQEDQPLDEATVDALQDRALRQSNT